MDIGPPLIDLYAWLATLEDATYASFSPGGPARVGSCVDPCLQETQRVRRALYGLQS
jgi:hypothetical protein